jgi:hypothetical protein
MGEYMENCMQTLIEGGEYERENLYKEIDSFSIIFVLVWLLRIVLQRIHN